ncbi:MAG TPA: PIN domain-containing protein, partial [Trueperaceae bacterium]|nr:PIN domain-containing protein [Trueperaceae bacterium]
KTALSTNFKDFEDSIQYLTALKIDNIEAIITRNIKDFRFSSIPVFSPEVYINSKLT